MERERRLGPPQIVLPDVGQAESLGVARDGSAVSFSTIANRRAQIVRIDGIVGLEG